MNLEEKLRIDKEKLENLEEALNYKFSDLKLLEIAFTHPSAENIDHEDYQRLEFLGDAVVELSISKILFDMFPNSEEGDLTKIRSNIVDELGLAKNAFELGLNDLVILGKGERLHGGNLKTSILSDVFESMMAVIFTESGWETAFNVLKRLIEPKLSASKSEKELLKHINRDFKTQLQEIAQERNAKLPKYTLVSREGPEHNLVFTIRCTAINYSEIGTGRNKKSAEQAAAEKIVNKIMQEKNDI